MSELQKVRPELLVFRFICPVAKEAPARDLLKGLNGVRVKPSRNLATQRTSDSQGIVDTKLGINIEGFCLSGKENVIVDALAANSIAGYSRDTQVFFYNPRSIRSTK